MKIDIINAALPPKLDGIGDYTALMAAEIARHAEVRILTGQRDALPIPGVTIETAFSLEDRQSVGQIARFVEVRKPDWILLQYQPFSYGRRGLNLHLPLAIRHIKRQNPGTKIALMCHEPFVRIENWRFAVMTTWQRWQLWSLGRSADKIFLSIEAWTREFQRWFPGKPVRHLPVMSNIPLMPISREEARRRLAIREGSLVIGMFGTVHVSRMVDRLRRAAEAAGKAYDDVLLLYMGPQADLIRASVGRYPLIADGVLESEEVSRRLSAVDIYISAFVDGVSTRRGSFMAGMQHGLAIAGTEGSLTDEMLRCQDGQAFLLSQADRVTEFDEHVMRYARDASLRDQMGATARQLYEKEFRVDRIATRLLSMMTGSVAVESEAVL